MEEKSLSVAFGDSLKEESIACISELAEVGLDAIMDEGIFKDIPILSTAVAVYKIGSSIKERHNMKKLVMFLDQINHEIADEKQRFEYQQKFQRNKSFRNQELEYILVVIDRYIGYDKAQMLACLYLAYLDGKIDWNLFAEYSEVIDRLLPSDFKCLFHFMCHGGVIIEKEKNVNLASVLRLLSVGLVEQQTGMAWTEFDNPNKKKEDFDYYITDFGKVFVRIFEEKLREAYCE